MAIAKDALTNNGDGKPTRRGTAESQKRARQRDHGGPGRRAVAVTDGEPKIMTIANACGAAERPLRIRGTVPLQMEIAGMG